jgi:hypothetical protein
MPRLRHLRLDTFNLRTMYLIGILGLHNSSHFPCLTVLHLTFVDLEDFPILPGVFPVMRRLILYAFRGPSLNLIQGCSGSLEDLRMTTGFSEKPPPHDRIFLPKLKVLIVENALGIVSNLEAPTLRLIYADLDEIDGTTRAFSSVVEWVTRKSPHQPQLMDITRHLVNMPHLRHLMLLRSMKTLKQCFESLRDHPKICPMLQSIEVVNYVGYPDFELNTDYMKSLEVCVAKRAKKITVDFVSDYDQRTRLNQYCAVEVRLVSFMRRYISYHASRQALTRSNAQ